MTGPTEAENAIAEDFGLRILLRELRDCWEGCIPWREAIEMIGAPQEYRPALRRHWNSLNRRNRG